MTDNEIIKALECCRDCKCKECPCYKNIEGEMRCTEIDEEEILDLINRQKAKIESLKHRKTELQIRNQELQHEKSEAIKEFAERLKDEMRLEDDCRYDCMNCLYECKGYVPLIDNLVKEMTEANENE